MFETAILVLLYNKEITESDTINSLFISTLQYENTKVILWNNGPKKLTKIDTGKLQKLGYDVEIKETLENESLALIYNSFLEEVCAKKYIFLDDDSALNENYILASSQVQPSEVAMPVIKSAGQVVNPVVNGKACSEYGFLKSSDKAITIGSGIVLGYEVADKVVKFYQSVFDQRFFLYGVDTTFCLRIFIAKLSGCIKVIPGFEHSLSRHTKESREVTDFRRLERSYDLGLTLRFYIPFFKRLIILTKVFFGVIVDKALGKPSVFALEPLFKALLSGVHYRAKK